MNWAKIGLFAGGALFGSAGIEILTSKDAKKLYTQCTAAVLRMKDQVMKTATTLQENCGDILADAKEINEERALSQGRVTVGITNYLATAHLPRMLPAFHREHPGIEVRIGDPETCEELPRGEVGEILCRGYNVMKGYYKMPEATAQAIDKDGWLHFGDLAVCDENGYYKVTGRLKDMIIRGGENIYPKELEECLYHNDRVKDVQVIGVPSKKYGEEVCACVILKEGEDMSEEEIKSYYKENVAFFKIPKYVWIMDEFPMTASGKIQKFVLRDMAVEKYSLQSDDSIETA